MTDDRDGRAFHPLAEEAMGAALEYVPPPDEHDWRSGGRGFVCPRCGAEKTGQRRNRRGRTVVDYFVAGGVPFPADFRRTASHVPPCARMDADDVPREALLRRILRRPCARAEVRPGIDHEAYHVYLRRFGDGAQPTFACVVLPAATPGASATFSSELAPESWPDLDVAAALRRWCARCFRDLAVPQFVLEGP